MPESAKSSKMLALFNTLDEDDKDIVITLSETLAVKYKKVIDLESLDEPGVWEKSLLNVE